MATTIRCGPIVAAALLSVSCAMKLHPYELEDAQIGAPGVRTVALLPLNAVLALPSELDGATRRVTNRIRAHLRACGVEVIHVGLGEARTLWSGATSPDSEEIDGGAQVERFVEHLHAKHAFDVVVMPSLVYREARIRAVTRHVDWDGVQRTLQVVGHLHTGRGFYLMGDFAGKMPGVSLQLRVYDASGARVFDSYGGLDLVHEADIRGSGELGGTWDMRLKRNPLSDDEAIREGVTLAFTPYLDPLATLPSVSDGGAP